MATQIDISRSSERPPSRRPQSTASHISRGSSDISHHEEYDRNTNDTIPHTQHRTSNGSIVANEDTRSRYSRGSSISNYTVEEQNENIEMDEIIQRHRAELQRLVSNKTNSIHNSSTTQSKAGSHQVEQSSGYTTPNGTWRTKSGERLLQLSRTEEKMNLDELADDIAKRRNSAGKSQHLHDDQSYSNHQDLKIETGDRNVNSDKNSRYCRGAYTPPSREARVLGNYTKDYVQKALDFNDTQDNEAVEGRNRGNTVNNRDQIEDDRSSDYQVAGAPPLPPTGHPKFNGKINPSQGELHAYVKQMESTIAHLVEQKNELKRNQDDFDRQASGVFPSLEKLNFQLSQLVHENLLQQSQNNQNLVAIKDDVYDELRAQGEQLSELEAELKHQKHDAKMSDQNNAVELSKINAKIVGLVTSGKLRDEKNQLLADSIKELQEETRDTLEAHAKQIEILEKIIQTNGIETSFAVSHTSHAHKYRSGFQIIFITSAIGMCLLAIVLHLGMLWYGCPFGLVDSCLPLT